jgi:D-3-phosphoglycerate dehydrogenase
MVQIKSVLIADEIEQQCLDVLKSANISVVKKTRLPKEELIEELKKHDAVIVRSATKVKVFGTSKLTIFLDHRRNH